MNILRSTVPKPDYPSVSITDHVLRHASMLSEKTAFIEGMSGRIVTYGQLADRIRALAGGLVSRGIGPGTTWALLAPNIPEYAIVFHGPVALLPPWTKKAIRFAPL